MKQSLYAPDILRVIKAAKLKLLGWKLQAIKYGHTFSICILKRPFKFTAVLFKSIHADLNSGSASPVSLVYDFGQVAQPL